MTVFSCFMDKNRINISPVQCGIRRAEDVALVEFIYLVFTRLPGDTSGVTRTEATYSGLCCCVCVTVSLSSANSLHCLLVECAESELRA